MAEHGFSRVHLIQLHDTKILYTKSWYMDSYHLWRHLRLGFFPKVWSGMTVRAWSWAVCGSILFTAWRMHYFSITALVRARHTPANSMWSFPGPTTSRSSSSPLPHIHPIPVTTFNFPACSTFQLLSLHKTFHTCTPISCHLTKHPVFSPTNFLSLFSLTELLCSIYKWHSFLITLLNLLLLHLLPTPCSFHFLKLLLLHLPTTPLHCHLTKLPVGAHINYNPDLCHILSILYTQSLSDALNLPVCSTYGPLLCTAPLLLLACHSSLSYLCNIPPVAPLNHWLLGPWRLRWQSSTKYW